MSHLQRAISAAEDRKSAVFGEAESTTFHVGTDDRLRLVFLDSDLDADEVLLMSRQIATTLQQAYAGSMMDAAKGNGNTLPLSWLFQAAWTEGLLVGLFASNLPPAPESDGTDATGSGEDDATTD